MRTPPGYGPITACQVCETTDLRSVVFVGYLPPVNRLVPVGGPLDQEPCFPAELLYCRACHLVQLGYAVDPTLLFPPDYPYTSGTTRILRENFAELYRDASALIGLVREDLVVDIGSNDGTLLSNFAKAGHRVVGIEPSLTAKLAEANGIPTLMRFFDRDSVQTVIRTHGAPKIVTATNVFAHIHRIHDVVDNLEALLGQDGVFISESHYLRDLVDTLQYDTIYHEHLRYYTLTSLVHLLESHGLRVFSVKRIPTHGGSIRVYASKSPAHPVEPSVPRLLDEEAEAGLTSEAWIDGFQARMVQSKLDLYALLADVKRAGARLYGIGAPSRASTFINYAGLDDGIVSCVLEVPGSKKLNKYIPGTTIPILEESKLYADQPEFAVLLSWHIASELCVNLKQRGYRGDFLVPLPSPRIIRNAEVEAGTPQRVGSAA